MLESLEHIDSINTTITKTGKLYKKITVHQNHLPLLPQKTQAWVIETNSGLELESGDFKLHIFIDEKI